jgi:hypothetical protein
MGTGRGWEAAAKHVGKVDAAFLDDSTVLDHASATAPTRGSGPGILDEARTAVFGFKGSANAVLQVEQIGFYGLGTGRHGITLNRDKRRGASTAGGKLLHRITPHPVAPQLTKIMLRSPIGGLPKRSPGEF